MTLTKFAPHADLKPLRASIQSYQPDGAEKDLREEFMALLDNGPACLMRNFFAPGHITASGLVIYPEEGLVLLNHHRTLNKWLCFGGHVDGESDAYASALREIIEESGIKNLSPLVDSIYDLDIHPIPANPARGEPDHFHFDVRYLFAANTKEFLVSDESNSLEWCDIDAAFDRVTSSGMKRLLEKAEEFLI